MNQYPKNGPAPLATSLGDDSTPIKGRMKEFDAFLDRIRNSGMQANQLLFLQIAVASGLPTGEGPGGTLVPPEGGYRIHPALLYGGWINPAKSNRGSQHQKRGEVVLGVPPSFEPKAPVMARAHHALTWNFQHSKSLPPVVVTTPRELGPRHSRLMVGLLLDLVVRCADKSLEVVLSEIAYMPTFRQRLSLKELRRMVGKDLTAANAFDLLDDLRRTVWSIPFRTTTWSEEQDKFVVVDYNVTVPGLSATPTCVAKDEGDGGTDAWRPHVFDLAHSIRTPVDIFWDARALGWAWSTAQFLKTKKNIVGRAGVDKFREALLEESSPLIVRSKLLESLSDITRDHLRMGLEMDHEKHRAGGLMKDVFGVTDASMVEKGARRAERGRESVSSKSRQKEGWDYGVTTSLFNDDCAGMAPEPENQPEILAPAGMAPVWAGMAPGRAGMAPERAGMAPERAGMAPERAGMAPERAGMAPGGDLQKAAGSSFFNGFSAPPSSPTNNYKTEKVGNGSDTKEPGPETSSNLTQKIDLSIPTSTSTFQEDRIGSKKGEESPEGTRALKGMEIGKPQGNAQTQAYAQAHSHQQTSPAPSGTWKLGFIPSDAAGRPWSQDEIDAYFQAPSFSRRFREPFLSALADLGVSQPQVAQMSAATTLTDQALEAFLAAVVKANSRGRVASVAAVVIATLSQAARSNIVPWLSDHFASHRRQVAAIAGARKALYGAGPVPAWVSSLPVQGDDSGLLEMIQAHIQTNPLTDNAPARALGTELRNRGLIPQVVVEGWRRRLSPLLDERSMTSGMVRDRCINIHLDVMTLLHLKALTPETADKMAVFHRQL